MTKHAVNATMLVFQSHLLENDQTQVPEPGSVWQQYAQFKGWGAIEGDVFMDLVCNAVMAQDEAPTLSKEVTCGSNLLSAEVTPPYTTVKGNRPFNSVDCNSEAVSSIDQRGLPFNETTTYDGVLSCTFARPFEAYGLSSLKVGDAMSLITGFNVWPADPT